jgi:uncharacterized membrane protein
VKGRRRIRRYFLTGLVVLAPLGLTAFILVWLFQRLDAILGGPLRDVVGWRVPGVGLLLLVALILFIGWLAHYTVGHQLIAWWNTLLGRFPLTARIYNATSQIVQTFMGDQRRVFLRTVLIPYPSADTWALAWVTKEGSALAEALLGEPCVHVFVASTPNPTTGWFLIVPVSKTRALDITVEEGMKLVLSAGAVVPRGVESDPGAGLDLQALLRRSQG